MPWEGNPHRPFCSERCRLVDLGAWLDERYAIPGDESEDVAAAADPDPDAPVPGGAVRREGGAVAARSTAGGKPRRRTP